ncbi:YceI family protein [Roseateles sp.]|uniref:YceI family protein n=1 Tax=Roseateles sp. TaxID=1971397 RepID=UPI0032678B2C
MKNALLLTALLAAAGAAHAESATYVIDKNHTAVTFEAKHFGTSTLRGRWDKKEGTVTLDKAAKTGKVEFTIDMASITTGSPQFDGHLKSKDFFLVEEFPTAKFVGDKFTFNGDKVTSVSGELTLRGKTNPVTLTATNFNCYDSPMLKREVCGGDFETTLMRSQFGVSYALPAVTPDAIRLLIQVEAVKQ